MSSKEKDKKPAGDEEGGEDAGISGALGLDESPDAGVDDADYVLRDSDDEGDDEDPTIDIHQYLRTSDDVDTAIEYTKLRPWSIKLSRFEISNDSDAEMSPFLVVRLEDQNAVLPACEACVKGCCMTDHIPESTAVQSHTLMARSLPPEHTHRIEDQDVRLAGWSRVNGEHGYEQNIDLSYRSIWDYAVYIELWDHCWPRANKLLGVQRLLLRQVIVQAPQMQFQVRNRDPAASRGEAPRFIATVAYSIEVEVTDPEYVLRLSRWQAMVASTLLRRGVADPEPGCCGCETTEGGPQLNEKKRILCDYDSIERIPERESQGSQQDSASGASGSVSSVDAARQQARIAAQLPMEPLLTADGPAFLRQRIARQLRKTAGSSRGMLGDPVAAAPPAGSSLRSTVQEAKALWGSAPAGIGPALLQHDRVLQSHESKREPGWVQQGALLIARFVVVDDSGSNRSDMIEMSCPIAADAQLGGSVDAATVVGLLAATAGNGSAKVPEMHVRGTRSQLESMRLKVQVLIRNVRSAPRSCPTCAGCSTCVDATRCEDCLDDCCRARLFTSASTRGKPHDPYAPFNLGNSMVIESSSRLQGVASLSLQGCTTSFLAPLSGHVVFDLPALRMAGWPRAGRRARQQTSLPGLPNLPGQGLRPHLAKGRVIGALIRGFVEWRAMKNRLLPLFSQPASAVSAGARFQKTLADAVFVSLKSKKANPDAESGTGLVGDVETGDGDMDDSSNRTGVVGSTPDGSASQWPGVLSGTDASAKLRQAGVQARVRPSRFLKPVHKSVEHQPHLVINLTQIGGIERLLGALRGDPVVDASTSVQRLEQGPGKDAGSTGGEDRDFVIALRWAGQQHSVAATATSRGVLSANGPLFLEIPLTPGAQEKLTGIVSSVDDSSQQTMFREELIGALSQLRAMQLEVWTAPGIGPVDLQDASRLTERAVLLARGSLEIPFELMIPIIREEVVPPTPWQRAALALGPIMSVLSCCSSNDLTKPEQDRSPRGLHLRIPMLGPDGTVRSGAAMRRTRCEIGLDVELVGLLCPESATQMEASPDMIERETEAKALGSVAYPVMVSRGMPSGHKHLQGGLKPDYSDTAADSIIDRIFEVPVSDLPVGRRGSFCPPDGSTWCDSVFMRASTDTFKMATLRLAALSSPIAARREPSRLLAALDRSLSDAISAATAAQPSSAGSAASARLADAGVTRPMPAWWRALAAVGRAAQALAGTTASSQSSSLGGVVASSHPLLRLHDVQGTCWVPCQYVVDAPVLVRLLQHSVQQERQLDRVLSSAVRAGAMPQLAGPSSFKKFKHLGSMLRLDVDTSIRQTALLELHAAHRRHLPWRAMQLSRSVRFHRTDSAYVDASLQQWRGRSDLLAISKATGAAEAKERALSILTIASAQGWSPEVLHGGASQEERVLEDVALDEANPLADFGIDDELDSGVEGEEGEEGKSADIHGEAEEFKGIAGGPGAAQRGRSAGGAAAVLEETADDELFVGTAASEHAQERPAALVARVLQQPGDPRVLADELLGVAGHETGEDSDNGGASSGYGSDEGESKHGVGATQTGIPALPTELQKVLERWPRVVKPVGHVLQDGHASVVEHAMLLCSLLRSLGEDAYVCAGLALPLGGTQPDADAGSYAENGGSSSQTAGADDPAADAARAAGQEEAQMEGWMRLAGIRPTSKSQAGGGAADHRAKRDPGLGLRGYLSDGGASPGDDGIGGDVPGHAMQPSISDRRMAATLAKIDAIDPDGDRVARPHPGVQEELHFWVVVFPRKQDEESPEWHSSAMRDEVAMSKGVPKEVQAACGRRPEDAQEERSQLGDAMIAFGRDHAYRALHSELGGHAVTSSSYSHSFRCSHTITGPPKSSLLHSLHVQEKAMWKPVAHYLASLMPLMRAEVDKGIRSELVERGHRAGQAQALNGGQPSQSRRLDSSSSSGHASDHDRLVAQGTSRGASDESSGHRRRGGDTVAAAAARLLLWQSALEKPSQFEEPPSLRSKRLERKMVAGGDKLVTPGHRPSAAPTVQDDPFHTTETGMPGHTPRRLQRWDSTDKASVGALQQQYVALLRSATGLSSPPSPIASLTPIGTAVPGVSPPRMRAAPGEADPLGPTAVAFTAQPDFFEVSSTIAPGRYASCPPSEVVAGLPTEVAKELATAVQYRNRFRRPLMMFNDQNVFINRQADTAARRKAHALLQDAREKYVAAWADEHGAFIALHALKSATAAAGEPKKHLKAARRAAARELRTAYLDRLRAAAVSARAAKAADSLTRAGREIAEELKHLATTGTPPLPSLCSETVWDLRRGDCWEPLLVVPGGNALASIPWPLPAEAHGLTGAAVHAPHLSQLHAVHGRVAGHPAGSIPGHGVRPLLRRDLSLVEAKHVQDEIRAEVEDLIAGRRRSMGLSSGVLQVTSTRRGERALLESLLLARAVMDSFEPGSIDRHLAGRRTDALLELLRSGVRKGEREAAGLTSGYAGSGSGGSSVGGGGGAGGGDRGQGGRKLRTYVQMWQTALSHPAEVRRVVENSLEGPPTKLLSEPNCQIIVAASLEQIATGLLRTNVAVLAVYARG